MQEELLEEEVVTKTKKEIRDYQIKIPKIMKLEIK